MLVARAINVKARFCAAVQERCPLRKNIHAGILGGSMLGSLGFI
jgi:hypothetical protein